MDCLQRFVVVGQTPQDNAGMDSALYIKSNEHQAGNLLVANREEVIICPAPRRPKSPYTVDHLNRLSCRPKSNLPLQRGGLEFLDIFLTKDDFEDDSHSSNSRGFFCGSPPVRTNNPVVRDAQFEGQAPSHIASASPSGKSSGRVERVTYCGTLSSLGGKPKPKVRIEGFACGSSESQCIVSALA